MEKCVESSSKEEKGKRLRKKMKYQLVEYHSLPAYLRDNEYIIGHYRSEWPMKQLLLSAFSIHNETLNVWTMPDLQKLHSELITCLPSLPNISNLHKLSEELKTTLPSLSNVGELLYNCLPDRFSTNQSSRIMEDVESIIAPLMVRPITRRPFFAFIGGAMFCLLASSACHLLSCHSERISYIVRRLDYAGIAALISTSFYPPVYYSFICEPFFLNLYLGFITVLGVATIMFSFLPGFHRPEFRTLRASLFFGMGMSGVAPIVHKLTLFWNQPEALHTTWYEVAMGILYGAGALVYATRIPERWMPGKFDIAGQSHQLFHVLVVAGACTHYRAGLVYLKWRDVHGC
ncbi:Heptahelical transmembrane protein ADIPOR3 [Hibiscus syriacus]|uniref:Heptahelical transmembrane protein ADIPOR3 n=1 Tax=Hibiscus syriacus TaxID=106335 RepID=A0A6A2ZNK1_HIBSY|nr:Heptahelical transmembrane protein ADIPOR3 [Hibiscus syriacus]